MKSRTRIGLSAAGLAAAVLIIALLFADGTRRYHWVDTYRPDSDEPYATSLLYDLLVERLGQDSVLRIDAPLEQWFSRSSAQEAVHGGPHGDGRGALYLVVGHELYPGEVGADSLLEWVARGNTALLALQDLPYEIIELFGWYECDDWSDYSTHFSDTLQVGFYENGSGTGTIFTFPYKDLARERDWRLLGQWFRCRYNLLPANTRPAYLGGMIPDLDGDSLANFFAMPYGDGAVFCLSTPLVLTNYHLRREEGLAYVDRIFRYLPEGPVHWEGFNQVQVPPENNGRNLSEGPLAFVLAQPALRWAWYLLLATAVLYLIFRAKRRQAPIPVLDPKENRSMEFVDMVALLHYRQNDHLYVAGQVRTQFLDFVRDRYLIPIAELNERFAAELSAKSEIPLDEVLRLTRLMNDLDRGSGEPEYTLRRLHERVHEFMRRCV